MNKNFHKTGWSDADILKSYIDARDRKKQIAILSELTLLPIPEIKEIIKEGINLLRNKDQVEKMYNEGATDAEICKETGSSSGSVCQWRQNRSLPKNEKPKTEEPEKPLLRSKDFEKKQTIKPAVNKDFDKLFGKPEKLQSDFIGPPQKEEPTAETLPKEPKTAKETAVVEKTTEPEEILRSIEKTERHIETDPVEELTKLNFDLIHEQYYKIAKETLEILKKIWDNFPQPERIELIK
ncbi:MAG: hypothetical protein ABFD76_06730 [Smithella sp.]